MVCLLMWRLWGVLGCTLALSGCSNEARTGGEVASQMWPEQSTEQNPTNFVIIMADDMGYGDLSVYGNADIKTPNLDAMAASGMRFTDFHSNGAVCSPTRAALLTGQYQQRNGVDGVITAAKHRNAGMDTTATTLAELLEAADYQTALFGKWHLGYDLSYGPIAQGFDEFSGFVAGNIDYQSHYDQEGHFDWWRDTELKKEQGYATDLITANALEYLDNYRDKPQDEQSPFFMYIAHAAPHYPYQGPNDPAFRRLGFGGEPVVGHVKDRRRARVELMESLDQNIGRVMQRLQELELDKNTLVIFLSDNGPDRLGSSGHLRGKKATLWEGGHRVPAIAYWPGKISAGTVNNETLMTMDIFPTFGALAGLPTEGLALDGVNLTNVLLGTGILPERELFWAQGKKRAMRSGAWKMVDNELFNLGSDPSEQHDLSTVYPERAAKMSQSIDDWYREVNN